MTDRLSVFYHPQVLDHDTGSGFFEARPSPLLPEVENHPEGAKRIRNMLAILQHGPISEVVDWHQGVSVERSDLERFHEAKYLDALESIPADGSLQMSSTTVFGPETYQILRRAAGQVVAAATHVFSGDNAIAYALVRPPGHHAQPGAADGYCFINNVGVAIEKLRTLGLRKAAVIDWDVHHGNGTQEGFYEDPDILTISMHMYHGAWGETHRQTGGTEEAGRGEGHGFNLNIPMPFGSGDVAYNRVFEEVVVPVVLRHEPHMIFVACGQDANQFDPNGRQLLTMDGFHGLGQRARALADRCCGGRLVLAQEGGYQISYSAYCLHATLEGVLNREQGLSDPLAYMMESTRGLEDFIQRMKRHAQLG